MELVFPAPPPYQEPDVIRPIIADSITAVPAGARGQPLVCASHGGLYAAHCALRAGVSAVLFNDAGIGRERAGIAGLDLLDRHGIPAVAVSHRSARIGDGLDCYQRGVASTVNDSARAAGAHAGMTAQEFWHRFALRAVTTSPPAAELDEFGDDRFVVTGYGDMPVVAMNSISLVTEADRDAVVITGSHGGLLGGNPRSAIKTDVFASIYSDADIGIDDAGLGRLVPLNDRGIAAVTVSAWSARIGDARSTLEDGVVSFVNERARAFGAHPRLPVRAFLERLADYWPRRHSH